MTIGIASPRFTPYEFIREDVIRRYSILDFDVIELIRLMEERMLEIEAESESAAYADFEEEIKELETERDKLTKELESIKNRKPKRKRPDLSKERLF